MPGLRIRSTPVVSRDAAAAQRGVERPPGSYDDYLARLVKLVPAEIVGLYTVGKGFVDDRASFLIGWILVCAALCVFVRSRATKDPGTAKGPQWPAVVIATVSFLIWVYSGLRGSPLACPPGPYCLYIAAIASLSVLLWTFLVPYFYTGD